MPTEPSSIVTLDISKAPQPIPNQQGTIIEVAKGFQVNTEQDYAVADHMVRVSLSNIAKVESFFEGTDAEPGIKVLAHRAHAAICEKIRTLTAPWRAVRPALEPKMKKFRAEQERLRREAEIAAQRQRDEADRIARAEAARIQREADAAAALLREQGEMRAAKETVQVAAVRAEEVQFVAAQMAEVGLVLPDSRPSAGPGESRPWIGEVTDIKAICLAIGKGEIPLEYLTPVRGQGDQLRPLVTVDQGVLNNIAKRMGRENINVPGARGVRGLSLRFSSKDAAPLHSVILDEGGWE